MESWPPIQTHHLQVTNLSIMDPKSVPGRSHFTVHLNEASSSPKTTPAGLPQGAVLSTTLFALYISDIPHPPNTQLALYADDTAILTQSWRTDTITNRLSHAISSYFVISPNGNYELISTKQRR